MLLRETDVVAHVVVGDSDEPVPVVVVEGRDDDFEPFLPEARHHFVDDDLTKFLPDAHRVTLHQALRVLVQLVVSALRWRVLVVPVDVLAMMTAAPTPRVTALPGPVRVCRHVVPVVPRQFRHGNEL